MLRRWICFIQRKNSPDNVQYRRSNTNEQPNIQIFESKPTHPAEKKRRKNQLKNQLETATDLKEKQADQIRSQQEEIKGDPRNKPWKEPYQGKASWHHNENQRHTPSPSQKSRAEANRKQGKRREAHTNLEPQTDGFTWTNGLDVPSCDHRIGYAEKAVASVSPATDIVARAHQRPIPSEPVSDARFHPPLCFPGKNRKNCDVWVVRVFFSHNVMK